MSKFSGFIMMVNAALVLLFIVACAAPAPAPAPTAAPQPTVVLPQATPLPVEPNAPVGIVTATPPASEMQAPSADVGAPVRLNVNIASPEEFLALPKVDSNVVNGVQQARPYGSIVDLRNALGRYLDPATVAELEQYVFVPIDVNSADAATLEQIPNVTPAIAQELIAGRPYGTNQTFLAKLVTLVSAEDTLQAQELLAP